MQLFSQQVRLVLLQLLHVLLQLNSRLFERVDLRCVVGAGVCERLLRDTYVKRALYIYVKAPNILKRAIYSQKNRM